MKDWKALQDNKTLVIPVEETFPEVLEELLGCKVDVDIKTGATTTVYTLNKMLMEKIIFVGVENNEYKEAFKKAAKDWKEDVAVYVTEENAFDISLGIYLGLYSYKKKDPIQIEFSGYEELVNDGKCLAQCINEARYWEDMPSNFMTPDCLKEQAVRIAKTNGLEIEVLSNKELEKIKAGGILAVNAGSKYPCYLITVKYNGNGNTPYLALVGKGLTFDAGGYSLKKSMIGMKYDMCGAANNLAVIDYVSRKHYKLNVMAVLCITENMIDADAYCVDHVLTMLNGKTVEITNTDAEGRLVLADGIAYAQRQNVCHIIDMATLTGACANALGQNYTGVFSNSDEFYQLLEQASKETKEKVWRLPVDEDFHKTMQDTNVADLVNARPGERAGASLAAAFLEEFVENNTPWIHLDIAGSSLWKNAGSGVMIQTLVKLIENVQI